MVSFFSSRMIWFLPPGDSGVFVSWEAVRTRIASAKLAAGVPNGFSSSEAVRQPEGNPDSVPRSVETVSDIDTILSPRVPRGAYLEHMAIT